jgi:hypothetical protein
VQQAWGRVEGLDAATLNEDGDDLVSASCTGSAFPRNLQHNMDLLVSVCVSLVNSHLQQCCYVG